VEPDLAEGEALCAGDSYDGLVTRCGRLRDGVHFFKALVVDDVVGGSCVDHDFEDRVPAYNHADEECTVIVFEDADEIGVREGELWIRAGTLNFLLGRSDQPIEAVSMRAGRFASVDDCYEATQESEIVVFLVVRELLLDVALFLVWMARLDDLYSLFAEILAELSFLGETFPFQAQ